MICNHFKVFLAILLIFSGSAAPNNISEISYASLQLHEEECLVPCEDIRDGGPGIDGIPAIDNPKFVSIDEGNKFWGDKHLVAGIYINGVAKAYPYGIMNWHEIVNDAFKDELYSLTYCPLTGSAILFERDQSIGGSTFGVSGMLYENNLIMYDRGTRTYWSQMLQTAIVGEKIGQKIPIFPIVETTWGAWKKLHPDTLILSRDTGYSRDYDRSPYGTYDTSSSIYFPSSYDASTLPYNLYHAKHKTVVIPTDNGEILAIPFEQLAKTSAPTFKYGNITYVTFFEKEESLAITYYVDKETNGNSFKKLNEIDPKTLLPLFEDENGNKWNFLGELAEGTNPDVALQQVPSYNAFWFAVTAFYPNANIYDGAGFQKYTDGKSLNQTFTGNVERPGSETLAVTFAFSIGVATIVLRIKRSKPRE